jgi:methyltransferase (TIGR00027 family)
MADAIVPKAHSTECLASFLCGVEMLPGQASQTLLIASIMRARHQLFDQPAILNDSVVLKLVPEAQDPHVLTEFGESSAPMASLMRSMFSVRSRFTEDRLERAAARGVGQYVMFGSGLDTFPWRQPDFAKDMQIFAVDHPASLIETNAVFRQRRFARPANLVRVPLDLEQRRIEEQLAACDFDRNMATFCSALGLMLYLDDEVVNDILRFVVPLPSSSEIVFSFVPPDDDLDGVDLEIARRAASKFATIGEPWKSRVQPRLMVERLISLGFGEVFHLSPELAQAQYFSGRSDKLIAPHFEQMIAATVTR